MVAGFNRSFSMPGSPRIKTRPPYHVRSISLPCPSRPLVSQLQDDICSVNTWRSSQPESSSASTSCSWLCDGLSRLEILHATLHKYLNLHGSGSGSNWTGWILDLSLRLADTHGFFKSEIMAMKEHQSEAQMSFRRKDTFRLSSSIKAIKKAEKQIIKLASSPLQQLSKTINGVKEAEHVNVIMEVIKVTVSVSTSVFLGIAAISSATLEVMAPSKSFWLRLKKKRVVSDEINAIEQLQEFEACIDALESRSERVFRCLVNTRVMLLTSLAPIL